MSFRPSRGFQSLPLAVSWRFGQDAPDHLAGQVRPNGSRKGFSVREHSAEELPDIGREPGEPGFVEHHSVGGVLRREASPVGQTCRGVETGVASACGEAFQRFVEPGDAVVQTGMFAGCRERQQDHRPDSRRIEPFADRPVGFQRARHRLPEQDFGQSRIDRADLRTTVQQPFVEVPQLLREQEILVSGVRHVVFRQHLPPVDVASLAVRDEPDDGPGTAVGSGEQAGKQPYVK